MARSKNAAIDTLLAEVAERFGEGLLRPASELADRRVYRSSGSISLDLALGGGWSHGTVVDVVGKQGTGKTLVFDLAAIEAQRTEKKPSVIFDFEHAYDVQRFKMLGGDPKMLYVVRSENFGTSNLFVEDCTDMCKLLLSTPTYACIGFDSTGAMVSSAEYELKEKKGEEGSTGYAYVARAMSSLLRQIVGTGSVLRSGSTIFVMSQMRDPVGVRAVRGIPPQDKRTGGRALPHYASVQIEVLRGETIKGNTAEEKQVERGHETKVRVRKNKCNAKQGRVAMFEIYTEGEIRGLDRAKELTEMAALVGVITRSGRYYTFPSGDRVGSFDEAVAVVRGPKLFKDVYDRTIALMEEQQAKNAMPAVEVDDE
jgi:recombination protein RecA